jgi:hypothetical protein
MMRAAMKMTIQTYLILQTPSPITLIKINNDTKNKKKEDYEIASNIENLNLRPQIFLPPLSPEELLKVSHNYYQITRLYMWYNTNSYYFQVKKANKELRHNISYKDKNEIQQKVINQNNRYSIFNKKFNLNNQPSLDRIDLKISHTLENFILTYISCSVERSYRSLKLMNTIIQYKQFGIYNHFPLVVIYM